MNDNVLTSMPKLFRLPELTRIDLRGNQITKLEEGIFEMMEFKIVKEIDLSHNLISQIPNNTFINW